MLTSVQRGKKTSYGHAEMRSVINGHNEIVGYQWYLKKELEKPVDCNVFRKGKELSSWHLFEIQALYTC